MTQGTHGNIIMRVRTLACFVAVATTGATATAQGPSLSPYAPPVSRPTVSPYLSLLNRNNSAAFNYYQLYRPQRRFQQAYEGLRTDLGRLESQVDRGLAQGQPEGSYPLGPTGHQTRFMNTGRYFPGAQR